MSLVIPLAPIKYDLLYCFQDNGAKEVEKCRGLAFYIYKRDFNRSVSNSSTIADFYVYK